MKLEVGMYVRTKYGITQYREYEINNCGLLSKIICMPVKCCNEGIFANAEDIVKASHNILELIEPMDLMFIDISPDDCGGIVVPRIAETTNELEQWKERISNKNCILKYVVTREQIESSRYKVGE